MERRRSTTPHAAVWMWEMMRSVASSEAGDGLGVGDSMPSILLGHD